MFFCGAHLTNNQLLKMKIFITWGAVFNIFSTTLLCLTVKTKKTKKKCFPGLTQEEYFLFTLISTKRSCVSFLDTPVPNFQKIYTSRSCLSKRNIFRCSSRPRVSEEHLMGPAHVCLSVAFFLGTRQPHDSGSLLEHIAEKMGTKLIVGKHCCNNGTELIVV
jgi:hypothetical protein